MRYILALLALVGCSHPPKNPYTHPRTSKYAPIIRLAAGLPTPRFFCSGTVISDKYIITAAHCVAGAPYDTDIQISTFEGVVVTNAKIAGFGTQLDVAVLKGDFSQFEQMPIETNSARIERSFKNSDYMQTCGYPAGGAMLCRPFKHAYPFIFFYSVPGLAVYPGMSGGPVIDLETGRLVGVNSAMTEHEALLTPVLEFMKYANVEEN